MQKRVLLLVAGVGYQQIEYNQPKRILEEHGIIVVTGSDIAPIATAKDGSTTTVDVLLEKVQSTDYNGIFFIGGPGALEHLDNQETNRILNEAMLLQIPYGAICVSPRILAKAHVLAGKRATGWDEDGALAEIFDKNNVIYVEESVVIDGNVITANGPGAAAAFGEGILKLV